MENDKCSLQGCSIAMVYTPEQEFEELYDADIALTRGTIFKQLDLPFLGKEGCCNDTKNDRKR